MKTIKQQLNRNKGRRFYKKYLRKYRDELVWIKHFNIGDYVTKAYLSHL